VQLPKGLPTIGVVALAAWAFFYPLGAWGFAAVEVVFLLSVALRLRKPAAPSREWASVLAAFGLSACSSRRGSLTRRAGRRRSSSAS